MTPPNEATKAVAATYLDIVRRRHPGVEWEIVWDGMEEEATDGLAQEGQHVAVTAWVPRGMASELKQRATEGDRTMSSELRRAIRVYLDSSS